MTVRLTGTPSRRPAAAPLAPPPPTHGPTSPDDLPALLEQLQPITHRILAYFRIPPWDAEDILQDLSLVTLRRWNEIRQPAPWFLAALRTQCLMYHRARSVADRRFLPLEDLAQLLEIGAPPLPVIPSPADQLDTRVDLRCFLRQLSATQRLLLIARHRLGMVDHEAAQLTGLAVGSIRKLTSRALARLRAAAGGHRAPGVASTVPSRLSGGAGDAGRSASAGSCGGLRGASAHPESSW